MGCRLVVSLIDDASSLLRLGSENRITGDVIRLAVILREIIVQQFEINMYTAVVSFLF